MATRSNLSTVSIRLTACMSVSVSFLERSFIIYLYKSVDLARNMEHIYNIVQCYRKYDKSSEDTIVTEQFG